MNACGVPSLVLNSRLRLQVSLSFFLTVSVALVACSFFSPAQAQVIARIEDIRAACEQSEFFRTHECIGSSLLFAYDRTCVGGACGCCFCDARWV